MLKVLDAIETFVCGYYVQFGEPCELVVCSRRFSREARSAGLSVTEACEKLEERSRIHIVRTSNGKGYCYPIKVWREMDWETQEAAPSRLLRIQAQKKTMERELRREAILIPFVRKERPKPPPDGAA